MGKKIIKPGVRTEGMNFAAAELNAGRNNLLFEINAGELVGRNVQKSAVPRGHLVSTPVEDLSVEDVLTFKAGEAASGAGGKTMGGGGGVGMR